jgi:hypothetical protein
MQQIYITAMHFFLRHREERSDVAIHGLPRFARNDRFNKETT